MRGVRLGNGQGDPTGKAATVAALAEELGVKPRTARHRNQKAKKIKALREDGKADLAEKVKAGHDSRAGLARA
jgi:hypothetical protein